MKNQSRPCMSPAKIDNVPVCENYFITPYHGFMIDIRSVGAPRITEYTLGAVSVNLRMYSADSCNGDI